ncbi:hypothetical protein [Rhodococcus sp. ACS1]|uniref:hypothetical protein n=1 Tax=Rhodococcus sp. ACS1 TaxID=2028570 RepID=UPI0026903242|nr:hypothetical protein [Rhodococcus sp. ACS1]
MEPLTCRWVRAQLTVAQDLFDRQILGLKVIRHRQTRQRRIDVSTVVRPIPDGHIRFRGNISQARPQDGVLSLNACH